MADKVLAIVRETMLHENTLESLSFRPVAGEVLLALLQPDDRFQYPEHELLLTFSGLRSFIVEGVERKWWQRGGSAADRMRSQDGRLRG